MNFGQDLVSWTFSSSVIQSYLQGCYEVFLGDQSCVNSLYPMFQRLPQMEASLKMEAVCSSETFVYNKKTTQHKNPGDYFLSVTRIVVKTLNPTQLFFKEEKHKILHSYFSKKERKHRSMTDDYSTYIKPAFRDGYTWSTCKVVPECTSNILCLKRLRCFEA
jgi:hypothetical protein